MKKIIKNIIMSIFVHKVQFVCLVILIFLSSSFFIGVQSANASVRKEVAELQVKSGAHQFIIDLQGTALAASNPVDTNMYNDFYKPYYEDLDKITSNLFPPSYNDSISIEWSVVDSREVYSGIGGGTKNQLFKVIPYATPGASGEDQRDVNRPIIVKGKAPTNPNEIMVSTSYAYRSGIHIGDKMNIQSLEYTVTGFATSYDMLYPSIDPINKIPNTKNSAILYCSYNAYYTGNNFFTTTTADREIYATGRTVFGKSGAEIARTGISNYNFEKEVESNTTLKDIFKNNAILANALMPNIVSGHFYNFDNEKYQFYDRSNSFNQFIVKSEEFLLFFLLILLITSIFIISIITRKRVFQDINTIAIFKANGYYNWEISFAYMMFSAVISFVGIILGTFFSLLVYYVIYGGYMSFFMLPSAGVVFNIKDIILNSLIANAFIILFTTLITYIILMLNINGNVVKLINKKS